MSAFFPDFVCNVSFFRRCKKKKTIRTTMEGFVGGWVGGWMGGVALFRFPGGVGLLQIAASAKFFVDLFDVFSIVFCTSIFTQFDRFGGYFGHQFSSISASFWRSFSDAIF